MATGKARGIKRPSATSYSSATTIVVFVGLSVLGLWLLTSNSFTPPQSTTTTHITSIGHHHPQTHHSNPDPVRVDRSTGDKVDDAEVVEEPEQTNSDGVKAEATDQQDTKGSDNQDSREELDHTNSGSVKDETTDQQDTKGSDNQDSREEPEKQATLETQTTEESSMTQKQAVEKIREENPHSEPNVVTKETDHGSETDENQITDEDQQRRIDEHQKQGDEQNQQEQEAQSKDPNRATRRDQITDKDQQRRIDEHQKRRDEKNQQEQEAQSKDPNGATSLDQITDEDQQKRIDEHQKRGEEQNQQEQEAQSKDPNGATSHDQITDEDQQKPIDGHQKRGYEENQQEQEAQSKDSNGETSHDQINDEDQQRRRDEHQKRGDEQNQQEQLAQSKDPNGATSHDQIIDKDQQRRIDKHQKKGDEQNQEAQSKESTNQETKHEPLIENGDNSSIPQESSESKKSWTTQAHQSEDQKERRKTGSNDKESSNKGHTWLLCNVTAGPDYIPCLDNDKVIANIHKRSHHEHRERHCPEDPPVCLVPLPHGYKKRIDWPQSRDKIWYNNVPHTSLAEYKGHQNWVKVTGEFLTFPGGGTQFIHGALHYIEFLQEAVPEIAWGKHSRVVLDVGCGVASFGGYLFEKDVITLSFAPKDEHEAQVQFALERGIPAISAVMGSRRLPFPSRVFDVVHCARCRVPWHADGGALLLELNRVLRPGGYFVWSATPVYQKLEEDVQIWGEMSRLTVAMCWELITIKKDKLNSIGAAIYQKPDSNDCYEHRKQNEPPLCKTDDDPNAAWYILLQSCMHRIPTQENERGSQWPEEWPERLHAPPYWLNKSQMGIYGKPAPDDFTADSDYWNKVVNTMYMNDMGINWSEVRNVMDLRAVYGGFAAALKDQDLWVMNVVNIDSPDTLPIIYERGLFGMYHDWCESFSTYPRSYDLLHTDHLFSKLKRRCKIEVAMAEIDRILRPGGKLIMRDEASTVAEVLDLLKSLHWKVLLNHSKNQEGIFSAQKSYWRPTTFADSS